MFPNYFLQSIFHSPLVRGENMKENRVEAGVSTNRKKESQNMRSAYTSLTMWHCLMTAFLPTTSVWLNGSQHVQLHLHTFTVLLWALMAWDDYPSPGELQPQLSFRCCPISWCFPVHPYFLSPIPAPWHWLFYYEVHYKGCFTCLQLEVEILKILQLRVLSLCEKILLSKMTQNFRAEEFRDSFGVYIF